MKWRIMPRITMPDEKDPFVVRDVGSIMSELTREEWQELERQAQRERWDDKHPRCETCGQFLRKRVVVENPLFPEIDLNESQWVSHYVRDYWGEWDHI